MQPSRAERRHARQSHFTPSGVFSLLGRCKIPVLDGLYQAAAESLPDCPAKHASNKRPRQGDFKRDDPNMDRSQIRHLPPGNIVDYLRLFRAEHPTVKVSNTLFTKVWTLHFGVRFLQVIDWMLKENSKWHVVMINSQHLQKIILRTYAGHGDFMNPGTFHFRPWMLPHRHDYGLRGTADADLWLFFYFLIFHSSCMFNRFQCWWNISCST